MFKKLLATPGQWQWTLLRLAAGIMIFPHGLQKTFGMFGGQGFTRQMAYFTNVEHIPALFAFLAIMAEFLGGIGLIAGLLTRIAAFGLLCNMVVGALMVSLPNGFFMNWAGKQKGEGIEFHVLAASMAIVLISKGGGALSIDRSLFSALGGRAKESSASRPSQIAAATASRGARQTRGSHRS